MLTTLRYKVSIELVSLGIAVLPDEELQNKMRQYLVQLCDEIIEEMVGETDEHS